MSDRDWLDPQGSRQIKGSVQSTGVYSPYLKVEVWNAASEVVNEKKELFPPQRGYNPNDVRGGFNEYGESLVYHPDHYDPAAASMVLLMLVSSALPAGEAIGVVVGGVAEIRAGYLLLRALATKKGLTVLGHHPEYITLAKKLDARYFITPKEYWSWSANAKFLMRTIKREDVVLLSNRSNSIRTGSVLEREVLLLKEYEYSLRLFGYVMVPK